MIKFMQIIIDVGTKMCHIKICLINYFIMVFCQIIVNVSHKLVKFVSSHIFNSTKLCLSQCSNYLNNLFYNKKNY